MFSKYFTLSIFDSIQTIALKLLNQIISCLMCFDSVRFDSSIASGF
ncbi:hypothetical protein MtrunA17_Chr7g0232151 [Medicago truncatula]|uniref:Uncharacterized protein n=1 Tax=Medicago truncatula TaxID=3880 RepID=A0A396GWX7_MEDTR|nr:hypothetical protein MtrunA17_Chr7g0232151 [Medicago truncatula]